MEQIYRLDEHDLQMLTRPIKINSYQASSSQKLMSNSYLTDRVET